MLLRLKSISLCRVPRRGLYVFGIFLCISLRGPGLQFSRRISIQSFPHIFARQSFTEQFPVSTNSSFFSLVVGWA